VELDHLLPDRPVRVAFETLGCKLNQAETEFLARQLADAGCEIVTPDDEADIYLLNTCTVTHVADRKSRHLLRMAKRRNPQAKIVVFGCYAERDCKELSEIEGVDLVVGNTEKLNMKQILEKAGFLKISCPEPALQHNNRTRSFIKAQDGCNNFCTYCIVPVVRGREKSLPPEEVIREINLRAADGFKEVVLTGTEIGKYVSGSLDLRGLLQSVLDQTDIPRLRLSSVQPQEIGPELVTLWQNPRLCPHFHLSLQSGSDSVLARMNRKYGRVAYRKAADLIRSQVKDAAITTDIIVGFPGETEEEFEESCEFCREIGFSRIHVFSYSSREGTRAASMPDQIDPLLKKQRSDKMLALAESSLLEFRRRFIGRTQIVLFEQSSKGLSSGVTGNYIKVYTKNGGDFTNRLLSTKLIELKGEGMWGEVIEP
jgi:threonylcarbamoyladenosine tRNA methylthiotransferase MtaB